MAPAAGERQADGRHGVKASSLGTTPRSDGEPQVTYNGHPLYGYLGDSNAGDTNGQGIDAFGARWYVLSPSGDEIPRQRPARARQWLPAPRRFTRSATR